MRLPAAACRTGRDMPEGPEIRRTADLLAAAVAGARLTAAWFAFAALEPHAATLPGQRITAITPRGKALLIGFDHGWTLYTHNQLYGQWKITPTDAPPVTRRSLRVALTTARGGIWLYSASDVAMWRTDALPAHPYLAGLGPDVLDDSVDAHALLARLQALAFARRRLGGLLLDQRFLAGMGNYLRAEVLFAARLHPATTPARLSQPAAQRLAQALHHIPRRSYHARGIAPTQGMRTDYSAGNDHFSFQVFGRAGAPCPVCATAIVRVTDAGRRLYLCPHCQPAVPE